MKTFWKTIFNKLDPKRREKEKAFQTQTKQLAKKHVQEIKSQVIHTKC